jgi:hypothetical protein
MAVRRTPAQILVLSFTIGCGILIGVTAVGWHLSHGAGERTRAGMPDILLEGVTPAELERHGFHLSGKEPHSWNAISVRVFQDERGTMTLVRCHIAPDEVASLFRFPDGSRRPEVDHPPADWPWGRAGDPFAVPGWWQPHGGQSRIYEQLEGPQRAGLFANYDASTGILHFWQWMRSDWSMARSNPLQHLVADELAMAIEAGRRRDGVAVGGDGWIRAVGLTAADCAVAPGRFASGITTIDAAMLPIKHGHRYLLAVHGLTADQAWLLVGELPVRPLPADGAPPRDPWAFAVPPDPSGSLPAWFAPGPGRRAAHCLVTLGPGTVEAGRWVAYDDARTTLYVWDWDGPERQDPRANICP